MKINKRIIFLSNYFNHHQKPLSDALYKKLGEDYLFIENEPMTAERKEMGWKMTTIPSYVVTSKMFHNNYAEYQEVIDNADVVLLGSAPVSLIQNRIRYKKMIVRYSERPLKAKYPKWKYFFRLYTWRKLNPQYNHMVMLCASAYTCADYAKHFLYKDKCYRWGYFPIAQKYESNELIQSKEKKSILWCGRLLDWKHPEASVEVARRLKAEGYDFILRIIGTGEQENELRDLINMYGLQNQVQMIGNMSPEKVRTYMEQAGIYLITSDFREGWGAVLNESMNSACAVVVSHAIGSAPFLVNHGENGYIYRNDDLDDLYHWVKYLLDNPDEQRRLGKKAYDTIANQWNAEIAADRFIHFVEEIKKYGRCNLYFDGPCSLAEPLSNTWF